MSTKKRQNRSFLTVQTPDPTRLLRKAYVLALGLIAFLTIGSHLLTAHISEQQKESEEISYQIGRQRTLVQQIVISAGNYYRLEQDLDRDFMKQSLEEMKASHQYLISAINKKMPVSGHKSEALLRVYYNPPFTLDDRVNAFYKTVLEFSQYGPKDTKPEKIARRKTLMDKMSHDATAVLRPAMDAAIENYQAEVLQKNIRFYNIQLGAAVFILLVLAAEAFFIFRPLIDKIKNYNLMLQRFALEDSLTGLSNRRAFMNAAETELKRAKREKTPITVALLDLDHFKSVNDTYGHETGDKVLQHFAGIIKRSFRAGDIAGRIGGEEFAILLPKISHKGATTILQRLCDRVAATPCEYKKKDGSATTLSYTVSIGFTGPLLVEGQTIDALLARADEGLYKAKEHGRNRLESTDGDGENLPQS